MSTPRSDETPIRYFCTYHDKNYLARGLSLYDSLAKHHRRFRLFVLCMDDETLQYLQAEHLPGVVPVPRSELESADPELAATQATRSVVEYYFTSTASWIRFLLHRHSDIDLLTYVDADYFFFNSTETVFDEIASSSIAIAEHRFPPRLRDREVYGRFNVGWLTFRRDDEALACVEMWRQNCIEWCYDRLEGERFADQKYLDQWPRTFGRLRIIVHNGLSVAPWNLEGNHICVAGDTLRINGAPLVCFHFHGLKHAVGRFYDSGLSRYGVRLTPNLRRFVFEPYLESLLRNGAKVARYHVGSADSLRGSDRTAVSRRLRAAGTAVRALVSQTCVVANSDHQF